MADGKQLELLTQGVYYWNAWRKEKDEIPGLFHADLRGMNLSNIDLSQANLSFADLSEAILRDADLTSANLEHANLRNATLRSAFLTRANLSYANLAGADLSQANLTKANFSKADLTEVDLSDAWLEETYLSHATLYAANFESTSIRDTIFADTDLSNTKNLESADHFSSSSIDMQTFVKSGRLPVNFLRGCGLSDTFIEYLPSLLNEPIQFYSCFISYSSKNQTFAERLHADLQNKGVRCWFAPEDLKAGDKIRVTIDESIRIHDKLLIILSKQSLESDWVENEVEAALERERKQKRIVLFPIRLDDAVMKVRGGWAADIRRSRHIGDFKYWKSPEEYRKSLNRLLRDLKADE